MPKADAETRHASLQRAERAAGEAFGWPETPVEVRRSLLLSPTAIAAATAVTTVAATLTYFV